MMRILPCLLPVTLLAFGLLLGACDAGRDPTPAPTDAAPVAGATPATDDTSAADVNDMAGVTMRYACDREVGVDVMQDGEARARMPDGRIVKLSRIANSTPPVFTGASLYFRIGDESGYLSEDEGEEVACRPQ